MSYITFLNLFYSDSESNSINVELDDNEITNLLDQTSENIDNEFEKTEKIVNDVAVQNLTSNEIFSGEFKYVTT